MPELSRLSRANAPVDARLLELPEKAVQFGTGGFLRGFIEYFIDRANRQGLFNGRIVAVGSTGSGRDHTLNEQDGLYTLAVRGLKEGARRSEYQVITSLSRALSSATDWQAVLACAREPGLEVIFSNTTEAGIRVHESDALGPEAPRSFPAKLTSFLLERANTFDYSAASGVVVLPCELIEYNGDRLKELVLETAQRWKLDAQFTSWLTQHVAFCNTLVDRIVPGEPGEAEMAAAWRELGYRDELLTVCEVYRLFAIEADAATAQRLTFASADPGILIANDISPYRQRKVRLLNGTHSISAPLSLLAGSETVADALSDDLTGAFIRHVLFNELVVSTDVADAQGFASEVLDRFANPYIRHELIDITLQQTMKLRVRIVPAIQDYVSRTGQAPASIAFGFAAYLLYVRDAKSGPADEQAAQLRAHWKSDDLDVVARNVCGDVELWSTDLTRSADFAQQVASALHAISAQGARAALEQHMSAQQAV